MSKKGRAHCLYCYNRIVTDSQFFFLLFNKKNMVKMFMSNVWGVYIWVINSSRIGFRNTNLLLLKCSSIFCQQVIVVCYKNKFLFIIAVFFVLIMTRRNQKQLFIKWRYSFWNLLVYSHMIKKMNAGKHQLLSERRPQLWHHLWDWLVPKWSENAPTKSYV